MLLNFLVKEEYDNIPENVRSKIEKVFNDNSDQYLTLKALFETFKRDQEEKIEQINSSLTQEIDKKEILTFECNEKCKEFERLAEKLKLVENQNLQLKNDVIRHENESRTYRLQRDEVADENFSLQAILNRRTNELEHLKTDYDSMNRKFESAVQDRINAFSQLDEIQSKKIELDFKENRLNKEKELLTEQINLLTHDVTKHSNEIGELRREHTSQLITLQTQLQHRNEEIRVLLENEESYKKTIQDFNNKIEDLNSRLTGQSAIENQLQQKYLREIESRSKLADLYKGMSEESNKKLDELAKTAKELQKLLSGAETQYEDLERRFTINETTYQEHLQQKNKTISALKKELIDANNLITALKQDHLSNTIENLSPHAAAAYNIMRKGLTLTQIYTEYASVSEQLLIKTHDNDQLQNTFKSFIEELEGKAHILKKRNEDYAEAMATIDNISQNYDQLDLEYNVLKEKYNESERNVTRLSREREKLQQTVSDLSRQVCFLLKEVEESRGGEILIKPISDEFEINVKSDFLNSSDVISKKLVTFHDIQELQETNQKLLIAIRDLSEDCESAENKVKECNKEELEGKVRSLENMLHERIEAASRHDKIMQMMKNQLKMYQMLNNDSISGNKSIRNDYTDIIMEDVSSNYKSVKTVSVQTDNVEIKNIMLEELKTQLQAKKIELLDIKQELEASTKEHVVNEKMMLESLEKSEKNYQNVSQDCKKLLSRAENSEGKCKCLTLNIESLKTEISALEKKCKFYSTTIGQHEQTITALREEAMKAMSSLSRNEVLLENSKRECALLRESEARLLAERDMLKQDKQCHAYLLSNLESIKVSIDRSESEWKLKMEEKLETGMKECSSLRRRLQDEQDRYVDKISFLEQTMEKARSRLEDEKKCSSELLIMTNSLKSDLNERNQTIEELKEKLKRASCKSVEELELFTKNLQNKYQLALKDIEQKKELLNVVKKDNDEISKLSENFEKHLVSERENHDKYRKEMEMKVSELAGEVAGLQKQNNNLQRKVNELSNLNQTSMINLNDELMEEKRKNSVAVEDINTLKQRLLSLQNDLKVTTEAKLTADKKYTEEILKHTEDIKELKCQLNFINELQNKVDSLTVERETMLSKIESKNVNWQEEEQKIKEEMDSQNERLKDVLQQNELLLNQIQEISLKIAVRQSHDLPENRNDLSNCDTNQNADNLLQVISYLRREKNLASSQLEALSAENLRLKSEISLFKSQLEETRSLLKNEQDKTDISSTIAEKHAELINKVQTLNALSDSNRVLREERDTLITELAEIKEKASQIETTTIAPLRNENERLSSQFELLQTENIGLQKECTRWRCRVTEITENMNLKNSEDLIKSLNVEREAHNKTLENLRSVKQEKSKLEDQSKKLQNSNNNRITSLEKERNDLRKKINEMEANMEKVNREFGELQKTLTIYETTISELKSQNIQVKSIARRYKIQCQELTKELEDMKSKSSGTQVTPPEITTPIVVEIPIQEQDRLRQEGRHQVENEMNDRIKELKDQITANQNEIKRLVTENKQLQDTVGLKEVRATDILKQARNRIETLKKEADVYKKSAHIEKAKREEGTARQNVINSQYENRILKLEKEKTEMQTDRERHSRDVESLTQRINSLQRQLHSQQGVKSTVNSGQEKCNLEPPTANIKPMAGPSSSVTKSQQNQQSVAVTPWRSANETPLASIRPMSMQTRTAAVLPTSQTSCSASQSTVLVPPQQQLVDTSSNAPSIVEAFSSSPSSSSHSDYNMPSTSSSVSHTSVRQVVVTPQQTSHSAESTQDMEAECGNQELQSQASFSSQQQSSLVSQNQATAISALSQMTTPAVSQSQMPTVALVLPRIDLQNISIPGAHLSNTPEQSVVASSQIATISLVSASNQTDSTSALKRNETYYPQDGEDSNPGQVSASNQHSQQLAVVASSIETAPEQSIIIASSQQSNDKNLSEPSVASSNANSSNTVTTTQAGLKRMREIEVDNLKGSSSMETGSVQPQVKRSRRIEQSHEDLFRSDLNETNNADMLLRYSNIDVEYQVPTSSQRDQESDNLVIDSEAEDELEEDEQAMPDDGIIDENDDVEEYVEDEEEVESEEVYEMEEQDTTMTSYNVIEGPDIDEENVHIQDQDNEVEIMDEESNEVPNQSGRSDNSILILARRNLEQQTSEATSSGNSLRAQSASISSNQSSITHHRRPSTISPLNRQQNQQLLCSQGFEDNTGDDSIVPSTPTLCVPRRTDGFGEAVSSPHVPSGGRFTFSESNPPTSRAGVAQMVSEGIDDTRIDLSQLDENNSTGRSVPSTPLQSSPQDNDRVEVGQSVEDSQPLNEELSSNIANQHQSSEDILIDTETFQGESTENEFENVNESENLIDEPIVHGREENDGVTSDGGRSETQTAGTSQNTQDDLEEGREAEAVTKNNESRQPPQPIPTTGNTARRSGVGRVGRPRGSRSAGWSSNTSRTRNSVSTHDSTSRGRGASTQRETYRGRYRKQKSWNSSFGRY